MIREYRVLETEVSLPYQVAYGATWTRFFEGLKEEKIFGTMCEKCKRVLVPARSFCPRCFVDTDKWVEVSQEGTLVAWVLTNYTYYAQPLKPPFITGVIKLDGTDVNFLHLLGGFDITNLESARAILHKGIRVKAVWNENKTGNILDIKYFAPL